ncbi:MAG: ribosome assembly RNA-binding protein YhbY [Lachnospiraceae bacterium]|nr:ribosome assembly RNA-binding protein YhbY [Lachnospiraceae bacterium]
MTSKQRSYLMSLAAKLDPVVHVGKDGATPEVTASAEEAVKARELIKIDVLKNCVYDIREIAETIAERTRATVVTVIGRKIVLYRPNPDKKNRIELP